MFETADTEGGGERGGAGWHTNATLETVGSDFCCPSGATSGMNFFSVGRGTLTPDP